MPDGLVLVVAILIVVAVSNRRRRPEVPPPQADPTYPDPSWWQQRPGCRERECQWPDRC